MRVYISGAITGVKHADKLFARAEEKLELEGYEILKNWLGKTDEEMKEVDLESEWESYLSWQEDCRAEALAEARAEAMIERYESYAD